MDFAALNWMTLTVIGVALLAVVIAVSALRNRVSRPVEDVTERATHDLYDEEDRAHRDDGNGRF
jgi:mannose/fructose/N-acetylgalactosamine-specific phosphotransferase system component IIC